MKYFDETQTKWGFGDGGLVPPDAEACRTVYVEALNRVAVKLGSEVRDPNNALLFTNKSRAVCLAWEQQHFNH